MPLCKIERKSCFGLPPHSRARAGTNGGSAVQLLASLFRHALSFQTILVQ